MAEILADKIYWAAWLAVPGIGRQRFFQIQNFCRKKKLSWAQLWADPARYWSEIQLNNKLLESVEKFKIEHNLEKFCDQLLTRHIKIISYLEKDFYPTWLTRTDDFPPILYAQGKVELLNHNWPLAVVGTRQLTSYGQFVTQKIVRELCYWPVTIVSGFMYGADLVAQQTALAEQRPTVGVLGFGFDYCYPQCQRSIMAQFLTDNCCLISSFPPWTKPSLTTFPSRNRIIAGMSWGTIVTEAAAESGSLLTAKLAAGYGREVFAVPGAITSPYCQGVNQLVNEGATLIDHGARVIAVFSRQPWLMAAATADPLPVGSDQVDQQLSVTLAQETAADQATQAQLTPAARRVWQVLKLGVLTLAQLESATQLRLTQLRQILLNLQLAGLIDCRRQTWFLKYRGVGRPEKKQNWGIQIAT